MRSSKAVISLMAGSQAQNSTSTVIRTCPSKGLCYALNIPDSTAQSGSGSIYFQITSPTTNAWAAIAQGSQMAGANMFIMYQNADGSNVTVSPRTASGEVMPHHDTTAQITLLEGSGVSNGVMTANIRCDNCTAWSDGTLNLQSKSSTWLYAACPGNALMSNDLDATIAQHDPHGTFNFATTQAIGGPNSNPFTAASTNSSGSSNSSSSSGSTTVTTPPSDGSSGGSSYANLSPAAQNRLVMTHGSLATIAFVALFPLGALLMRVGNMGHIRLWIHGGIQIFAYAVFISGAGIGIYIAKNTDQLMSAHAIIGLLLLALVFFLPFSGQLHHQLYKKHGKRTIFGHMHANTGRIVILLGIINGGLGLQLADETKKSIIAYGVIAGIVGVAYIAMFVHAETRRKSNATRPVDENTKAVRH
ncbi:iron reductase domain protein [Myriangium duriaei CBS 260.36]|uniref:Iron reductase domain protein n=1 Tax=Myriangium duriaei CBS 260.36 TaxID=1168546 RepID=A0A9P4IWP9_9PEZI|nr:iron reductase domain protein [Myriangium duriaei CBS 260.36]